MNALLRFHLHYTPTEIAALTEEDYTETCASLLAELHRAGGTQVLTLA